jgi:hypothetical protein
MWKFAGDVIAEEMTAYWLMASQNKRLGTPF